MSLLGIWEIFKRDWGSIATRLKFYHWGFQGVHSATLLQNDIFCPNISILTNSFQHSSLFILFQLFVDRSRKIEFLDQKWTFVTVCVLQDFKDIFNDNYRQPYYFDFEIFLRKKRPMTMTGPRPHTNSMGRKPLSKPDWIDPTEGAWHGTFGQVLRPSCPKVELIHGERCRKPECCWSHATYSKWPHWRVLPIWGRRYLIGCPKAEQNCHIHKTETWLDQSKSSPTFRRPASTPPLCPA